jgi:HPt (histidine-containing phosphotransfer) domain-containing protein
MGSHIGKLLFEQRPKGRSQMSSSEALKNPSGTQAVDTMALLGRCLGNFKMVERVLTTFRTTGATYLDELHQAIETADFPAAADISHKFHGAASNVSATGLQEILKNAERLAREQCETELRTILNRLRPAWEEFERYSQALAPASGNTWSAGFGRSSSNLLETCHAGASR